MKCKYHLCNKETELSKISDNYKIFCSEKCKDKYFVDKRRIKLKIMAVAYKGGKCSKCGYDKCLAALEFHHRDKTKKLFGISHPETRAWVKLKIELDKCDIVCANCHREIEFESRHDDKKQVYNEALEAYHRDILK